MVPVLCIENEGPKSRGGGGGGGLYGVRLKIPIRRCGLVPEYKV